MRESLITEVLAEFNAIDQGIPFFLGHGTQQTKALKTVFPHKALV
jgi:hypothetical protein